MHILKNPLHHKKRWILSNHCRAAVSPKNRQVNIPCANILKI
ncbi:hypothetical protein QSI_3069 [Clostridioides difficile P28]|nr:hypothetical protein QSI_3069 [Clostridioides difficile P28]